MGASSATGTGHGSAEGALRGGIDQLVKVLRPSGKGAAVAVETRVRMREEFYESAVGSGTDYAALLLPPRVTGIDAKQGIVYFDNPAGHQIEIYKYTRKHKGPHRSGSYPPHLGKRYKVLYQLKKGATSWTVPDDWIWPIAHTGNPNNRSHFKFGVRKTNGTRSTLSADTIITAVDAEYAEGNGVKILYYAPGGGGKNRAPV